MDGGNPDLKVRYQRETFASVFEEAIPLLHSHYREIAHFHDIPLSPDVEFYSRVEASDRLWLFTARAPSLIQRDDPTKLLGVGPGRLIGYSCFFVGPNPHYSSSKQAVNDVIYVDPSYRLGRVGIKLVDYAEDMLSREGVQVISYHVKLAHPALAAILVRKGYGAIETQHAKRIGGR